MEIISKQSAADQRKNIKVTNIFVSRIFFQQFKRSELQGDLE